jgi:hypothetical protein
MRLGIGFFAVLVFVPAAASAEESKSAAKDPNRIICEKQEVLGSRLATKRVCMTAAEWETRRLEDRQNIDRQQIQRSGNTNGG